MTQRKPINKKMRFEVLKRDSFTCQYCGKMPPDTILHIDHIKPVSKGGCKFYRAKIYGISEYSSGTKNTMLNLVTSCIDCNLGKSDVELSDDSAVKKQQKQLSELAEKKAQIEMMINWRESLLNADELLVDSVENIVNNYLLAFDKCVSESGRGIIRKAVKKHGYQTCIDAIEAFYVSDKCFESGWANSIKYIGKSNNKSIHYIKGILKNRISHLNEKRFYSETVGLDISSQFDDLSEIAKVCANQTDFFDRLEKLKCQCS